MAQLPWPRSLAKQNGREHWQLLLHVSANEQSLRGSLECGDQCLPHVDAALPPVSVAVLTIMELFWATVHVELGDGM